MKIIRNYILKEFGWLFLLSLGIFTFVLLIGNLVRLADLIITKGVDIGDVFKLLLTLIPSLLSNTIPISALSATLLCFGRLSQDREIMAIQTSGVNLYKLLLYIVIVGTILSLFLLILNDTLLPKARYQARKMVKTIGLENPIVYLEPRTFIKEFQNYIIFIHDIDRNYLRNIRIYQPQENGPTRITIAEYGKIITPVQQDSIKLKLINGTINELAPGRLDEFHKLSFKNYYLTLNLSDKVKGGYIEKKPKDMTIREILKKIQEFKQKHIILFPLFTELHRKITLSFSCLIFILIGFSLGNITKKGGKSIGFGVSLIVIIVYYLLLISATAISLSGKAPIAITMWMPNILFFVTGIILLRKSV